MKKTFTIILFFIAKISFSQNLVPNPSFEQYDTCPMGLGQINYAVGWSSYLNTPDYFNSCGNPSTGIPVNNYGYQYARTGNAYAGFVPFAEFAPGYREIIGIQLTESLKINRKYLVYFYVNRAYEITNQVNVATNKIGAKFSTVAYSQGTPMPINNRADIYTDSIITDTLNWTIISGTFIADSAYGFIGIGNFFNDSLTTHIKMDSLASSAYYFIDDISVIQDTSLDFVNDNYSFSIIKVFPNPARDWIAVEGRDLTSYVVFDALGRNCIENAFAVSSLNKINLGSLSKGIYFIRINTLKNSFITKIILI